MSATSFQRMRRIQALQEQLESLEIDYSEFADDEATLRATIELEATEQDDEEKAIRAKAKELGIKSWHVKGIEKLNAEIAELELEKE